MPGRREGPTIHAVLAPPLDVTPEEAHAYLEAVRGGDALLLVLKQRSASAGEIPMRSPTRSASQQHRSRQSDSSRIPAADSAGCPPPSRFVPPIWDDGLTHLLPLRWTRGAPRGREVFASARSDVGAPGRRRWRSASRWGAAASPWCPIRICCATTCCAAARGARTSAPCASSSGCAPAAPRRVRSSCSTSTIRAMARAVDRRHDAAASSSIIPSGGPLLQLVPRRARAAAGARAARAAAGGRDSRRAPGSARADRRARARLRAGARHAHRSPRGSLHGVRSRVERGWSPARAPAERRVPRRGRTPGAGARRRRRARAARARRDASRSRVFPSSAPPCGGSSRSLTTSTVA